MKTTEGLTVKEREEFCSNITDHDLEKAFDKYIDAIYGPVVIVGQSYKVSELLYNTDPTTYRCYISDFQDDIENGEVEILIDE